VVDLGEEADAPVPQAVDEVDLPQRPRPVQRPGHDPGQDLRDLALGARRRDRGLAHVVVEVEVGVLDPVGQVEAERHLDEPPAEGRQQVQPLGDDRPQALRADRPVGRGRRVVDAQDPDVPERARRLDAQELRVERRQLVHQPPGSATGPDASASGAVAIHPRSLS
jgi:hypothetical protein